MSKYFFFLNSANLQSRVKKGKMTQEKFEKTMSLLKGSLDYESFKDVDMVIEVCMFIWFNFLLVLLNFWIFYPEIKQLYSHYLFLMLETGCDWKCFFEATNFFWSRKILPTTLHTCQQHFHNRLELDWKADQVSR